MRNYEGITLLSTLGKTFRKVGMMLEKREKIREGQAGFRQNCRCVDHMYTLGRTVQGRKDAGLTHTVPFWMHKRQVTV